MNDNVITPLDEETVIPGLAPPPEKGSNIKRLAVVAMMGVTVVGGLAYAVTKHYSSSADIPDKAVSTPEVASTQAVPIKMPELPAGSAYAASTNKASASAVAAASSSAGTTVPSITPMPGDSTAIAVNGTGAGTYQDGASGSTAAGGAPAVKVANPDDAPIFSSGATPDPHAAATVAPRSSSTTSNRVAEANASLDAYKIQLAGMVENLQKLTNGTARGGATTTQLLPPGGIASPSPQGGQGGQGQAGQAGQSTALFGSMDRSATPRVQAGMLGDRNMIVPKGTLFLCSLKTRVISATSGFIGCQVTRNVFSDNGKVLLIERGSHMDGEYRIVSIKPGVTRIPVLWTRVRTPQGVTIDLESPATGALGESGLGGYVDNRWGERLGAAVMLSLVNDALKYAVQSQTTSGNGNTVLLPNTTDQGSKLAEKVLETTINIPPLLYQNQGGVVGVYVSRDLDFSTVYELKPQGSTQAASTQPSSQNATQ